MTEEILTLDVINRSENLQRLGAMAGDKVVDGKLKRVFSTKEDKAGERLTASTIAGSKNLQDLGAEEGDRIVDGKLIRTKQHSAWQAFRYGKAKGEEEGITDYATEALEAYFPTAGRVIDFTLETLGDAFFPSPFDSLEEKVKVGVKGYMSPDEKYGEGFSQATPQERREMMMREKERNLQKNFPGYVPEGGVSETLGNIYGAIKDPTSVLPAGQSLKAMTTIGAGLGAGFSATQDLATTGEIDPVKAGLFAAGGAALPLGFAGAKVVVPKAVQGVSSLYVDKTSKSIVSKAQAKIADKQKRGFNLTENDIGDIARELGVSERRLTASYEAQGVQPKFYSSVFEADKALQAAIAEDSSMLRVISKGADNLLGAISTRLKNVDEGLYGRLMRTEFNTHKRTQEALKRVDPFSQEVAKLPDLAKQELNFLLGSGRHTEADQWMRSKGYDSMADSFGEVRQVLDDLGADLAAAGYKTDTLNYYPRSVKDHGKLLQGLGVDKNDPLSIALNKAAKDKGRDLTQTERDRVTERVLKGHVADGDKGLPQGKKRTMDERLTPELMAHYKSPEEALQSYIRTSINNLEKRKFFGNNAINDLDGSDISVRDSIDSLIQTMDLDTKQVQELKDVLSARFGADDGHMLRSITGVKNLGYIGTIGDFMSTLTQVADVPNIMGYHGFRNTLEAAFGKKLVTLDDVGVTDIARELGDSGAFSNTLNTVLKVTGFKRIDRFGKETLMNAVRKKNIKQLRTPEGVEKFKSKWEGVYGPDTDRLIRELQAGEQTELTNLHHFTKLSEHQPISYSEYPAAYLNNPNGRILYMLKSFTLKQWDLARRNLFQEFKKAGTKKEKALVAAKTAKVGAFMAAGGLGMEKTKDFLLGRDIKPEDIPTDALWALAGAFGFNKYSAEKNLKQGDVAGFIGDFASIPVPVFEGIQALFTGDIPRTVKSVPVAGRMLESHFFGGKEKYNKKLRRRR